MKSVVISSGHSAKVRGASGYLDEVDEARRVVESSAENLRRAGIDVVTYHDNVSTSQSENLTRICDFHNAQTRDLDVSVHFNAYETTSKPMGTECLYKTQEALAKSVAGKIAVAGEFLNRGAKYRSDLKFLNSTNEPAILVEVCFVDSSDDEQNYVDNYDDICLALAEAIAGKAIQGGPAPQPPEEPDESEPPTDRPVIKQGDVGPYVQNMQESLGIVPFDGDFGPATDGGVRGFQAACGLTADGIVGNKTWAALDELDARKEVGGEALSAAQIAAITELANKSKIASYQWNDRGIAPKGYIAGVACCFAAALLAFEADAPAMVDMAQADRNDDQDSLTWYQDQFEDLGLYNLDDGVDTLRHLFVLLLGLGMRESSGRYCEGRDLSADNVSADTAEAGLFQTSWNIRSCNDNIPPLLQEFWDYPNGFLAVFQSDVEPDSNDLGNHGAGDGAKYQFLSKFAPLFHLYVTALGLRYLGGEDGHWGPIRTHAAQLRPEADELFMQVQKYLRVESV